MAFFIEGHSFILNQHAFSSKLGREYYYIDFLSRSIFRFTNAAITKGELFCLENAK